MGYQIAGEIERGAIKEPIKSCPFCGGTCELGVVAYGMSYYPEAVIRCEECNIQSKSFLYQYTCKGDKEMEEAIDKAIKWWNRRI